MLDAIFSQPNYEVAKKALDAVELRHEAIASNIANAETPGYKRIDISPSFSAELQRASQTFDPKQIESLKPQLAVDTTAVSTSPDGNNVNIENEMLQMSQNSMNHALETQLVSGALMRLKLAITGKNG